MTTNTPELVGIDDVGITDLAIIVPAYNEGTTIAETVLALKSIKSKLLESGIRQTIYVVDDGSKDETAEEAVSAGVDKLVTHKLNKGLGAAVRSGLEAAHNDGADICVKFDADLQHDPFDILRLIEPLINDDADIVYGHRFNGIEYKMPFIRRAGNIVFSRLMKFLTGWPLKDSQPGIFAVTKEYTKSFYLPGDYNYTQQILLDAFHKGMRFQHVDVTFKKRETGKSFISLKYPLKVLPQILMVIVGVRPLFVFAPVGFLFLTLAFGLSCWEIAEWGFGITDKPIVHVNAIMGLSFFGMQALFFGLLAHLVVELDKRRNN